MNTPSNSMTHRELASIIAEANPRLTSRRLLEFRDLRAVPADSGGPADDPVFILLLEGSRSARPPVARLLVSLTADLNYVVVSPRRLRRSKKGEGTLPARRFDAALRGARLEKISLHPADRIVTVLFESPAGDRYRLIAELFGRHPNLVLLDTTDTVRIAFREAEATGRTIREGAIYEPPPAAGARSGDRHRETRRFAPLPATPTGPAGAEEEMPINAAADRYFSERAESKHVDTFRRIVKKKITHRIRKTGRRIAEGERKLREAARADRIRHQGDLLKAHFHLLRRGMESIDLPDILSAEPSSPEITIPLDPLRDPAGNLEVLYKRYRKIRRSVPHLEERLATDRILLAELEGAAAGLESGLPEEEGMKLEEIAALARRHLKTGGPRQRTRPKPNQAGKDSRTGEIPGLRRFRAAGGSVILAGRDGETNHRLLRLARGRDIWLHCHGVSGAHIVIPRKKGENAPLDLLLSAGLLAVHFSRRRGAEQADVIYTERKYVRPVKGGKKGQVLVERFKTLHLRGDAAGLKRILGTIIP
jgi:predicted ribosome quality control (RQC) complex YloA/Tae2 family protein